MDLLSKMWEVLTTLTSEAQGAVLKKCEELGFNPDRGDITLVESYINLSQARDILTDAIEKKKLTQFPLSIQKILLGNLENIAALQNNLISGSDEVVNLVNSIEELYTNIWKFGFHNLTDELLGYASKMNQLKYQAVKAKDLQKELENGLKLKQELEDLLGQIKKTSNEIQNIISGAQTNKESIQQNLDKTIEIEQKSTAHLAIIQQNDTQINQLLSNSKTSNSDILALESRIKELFTNIDKYKSDISTTTQEAKNVVEQNRISTDSLLNELKVLENQIRDQIQKATGYSLFHSFQTRQGNLKKSKNIWIISIGALILLSVSLTAYIAHSTNSFDIAFYLKLSMSIPLIYAITFCNVQYTRERKLEEEYAFKSNISISLIPYQQLVEKLVDSQNVQEREKYTSFIIESIGRVFASPTEKIFENDFSHTVEPEKAMKQLGKTLETILKPFEPLIKLIKH